MFKISKIQWAIILIVIIYTFAMVFYFSPAPAAQPTGDYSRCFGTDKHHSRCKNLKVV